ncbi:MAG: hypothetical protein JSV65_13390 [Armatimonadota bacterium]|nr:MAG: hypothetical protein JSV65_13390 [Armatimonadota bacterium]
MALRIIAGLAAGGGAGFALHLFATRVFGGGCPLTCNPYMAVGLGVVVGLMWALGI